ncbi:MULTISPECIES: magnesium/cobalt transporter CorA [unclassified Leptolyngbya]|uniref:magnesium/cobalt transporter CorA n=1 Tax=unclassified Leptolyngbya TaxID=2650499 RepID=UPI00168891CF|nr:MULTISPECIES: magnesium/cobalt transporter CorA [unclassified Leptolyngbya]MBD1910005.1 magnesium/cobalt transporter CorA [Leptolyngbya sp. FACHB-8]MBD2157142.1 magnesium/cobalt transporter CorA [Leptolyngbya sp. FACHB-16]
MSAKPSRSFGRWGQTLVRPKSSPATLEADDTDEDSLFDFAYNEPGAVPGTLTIEADAPPPVITLIDYGEHTAIRRMLETPEEAIPFLDSESVSWVDVKGLGNEDILQRLGKVFSLHPLVLEDVVNVPQRPKVEEYPDQLLLIARMVTLKDSGRGFVSEQVSFILGRSYLLTVQEEPEYDCFGPVQDRIRLSKGNIRKKGADFLAYALIDALIDGFFPVLETYGEILEELEDEVVVNPTPQTLAKVHNTKRELLALRRAIWPQRDAINSLIRDGSSLISEDVRLYLRDCYDHTVQVLDMVETYREIASSLMDVYLSSVSNRMNEVMKLLTVISSIFIPLTFVAGVYGMNFNPEVSPFNMPELNWYFGYPLCWAIMLAIAGGLIMYFHKRGWFNNFSGLEEESK